MGDRQSEQGNSAMDQMARYKQLTCLEEIYEALRQKILGGNAAILFNLG